MNSPAKPKVILLRDKEERLLKNIERYMNEGYCLQGSISVRDDSGMPSLWEFMATMVLDEEK